MAQQDITHETKTRNAPDFLAWHVTGSGENAFWTRMGAAWAHRDGHGFTLQLETLPIDGRVVLRKPDENAPETDQGGRA